MQSKRGKSTSKVRKVWQVTLAATILSGCAESALAQSSVTLYGFLYSGVRYVNNSGGHHVTGLATGPSRWGLKGHEDLGSGLRGLFTLESGFDMSTGNSR